MKSWQNGYDLAYLKEVEDLFKSHNEQMISPFLEFKKNNVADALHRGTLVLQEDFRFVQKEVGRDSPIKIYSSRPEHVLAFKEKGDIEISSLVIEDLDAFRSYVLGLERTVWILCSEKEGEKLLSLDCFDHIGTKYSSFGDCLFVFHRKVSGDEGLFGMFLDEEICKYNDPLERATCFQLRSFTFDVSSVARKIEGMNFSAHYSNYNDGGWGAVSLRGYSDDPMFITKPSEMNDKWHEKHPEMKDAELRDTDLYSQFEEVREMIDRVAQGSKIHRVRLMRLEKGKVIGQHTDLVDDDAGPGIGKLPRFHIPITTEDCVFEVWGMNGKESHRMSPGSLWYLDTRKPHSVVNEGSDRVHLVFDLESDEDLIERMKEEL